MRLIRTAFLSLLVLALLTLSWTAKKHPAYAAAPACDAGKCSLCIGHWSSILGIPTSNDGKVSCNLTSGTSTQVVTVSCTSPEDNGCNSTDQTQPVVNPAPDAVTAPANSTTTTSSTTTASTGTTSSSSSSQPSTNSGTSSSAGAICSPTSAQPGVSGDKAGPELAFFDRGGQSKVVANDVTPNSFTGTVQAINDINDPSAPYNPAPNNKTYLRLTGITARTTDDDMASFALRLKSSSAFPSGTIVIVGIELNNLEIEWKDPTVTKDSSVGARNAAVAAAAQAYAARFVAFARAMQGSGYRVAPAPPDMYNGIWDPKIWISNFNTSLNAQGGCSYIDALTANVFQVGGDWKNTYLTWQNSICGGSKKVVYFSAWGADPNNGASLRAQLDFIQQTALPGGIEGASTLIVNTCNGQDSNKSKSGWLYYVKGHIYDADGNEINPDTCSKSKCQHPFVYPGIEEQPTETAKLEYASHYILACGNQVKLKGNIENLEKIDSPSTDTWENAGLHCPGDPGCIIPPGPNAIGTATVTISNQKTTIPLLMMQGASLPDPNGVDRRMTDLQGFFGAKYSSGQTITNAALAAAQESIVPLANGTTQKLTSLPLQCQQTLKFLQSIKTLCDSEPDPSTRPLVNSTPTPVPTGVTNKPPATPKPKCALDLTVGSDTYLSVLASQPAGFTCDYVGMQNQGTDTSNPDFDAFVAKLNQVEIVTPKAFKPAYIVEYFAQPKADPTIFDNFENWFSPTGATLAEKARNRMNIRKVYVPAGFATTANSDINVPYTPAGQPVETNYTSAFMGTMQALTNAYQQTAIADRAKQEVSGILSASKIGGVQAPGDKDHLNCYECTDPNALETILAKRINAESYRSDANAQADVAESGNNLNCSSDSLGGEQASTVKQGLNPDNVYDPVLDATAKIGWKLHAKGQNKDSDDSHLTMRTYFLLPEEYRNIRDYENVLAQMFQPADNQLTFSAQKLTAPSTITDAAGRKKEVSYKYLQLSDGVTKLDSPKVQGSVVGWILSKIKAFIPSTIKDNPALVEQTTLANTTTIATDKTISTPVYLEGLITPTKDGPIENEPQVPGGKLARSVWEILCHVTRPFNPSKSYAPYTGLETLLTKGASACYTGSSSSSTGTSGNSTGTPTQDSVNCTPVFSSDQTKLQQWASELAANLPGQQSFWNAFFPELDPPIVGPQHLFLPDCNGGQLCYQYIINTAVANGINPYMAITIALNEDGGLRSDQADFSSVKHFGCDPFGATKFSQPSTIENKLQCMIGTLLAHKSEGVLADLENYDYKPDYIATSLAARIKKISNNKYDSLCTNQ